MDCFTSFMLRSAPSILAPKCYARHMVPTLLIYLILPRHLFILLLHRMNATRKLLPQLLLFLSFFILIWGPQSPYTKSAAHPHRCTSSPFIFSLFYFQHEQLFHFIFFPCCFERKFPFCCEYWSHRNRWCLHNCIHHRTLAPPCIHVHALPIQQYFSQLLLHVRYTPHPHKSSLQEILALLQLFTTIPFIYIFVFTH